jgi:16S rRNA (guanine(966)-N(2))-methyltransferase RsmD
MGTRKRQTSDQGRKPRPAPAKVAGVRIIGGRFRGRTIQYGGDPRTRPMKDRVREAVFNCLATAVRGKHVVDLFAGTGALGLEALSRGALRATLIEQHLPTAMAIGRSVAALGAEPETEIVMADAFRWFRRQPRLGSTPWLVFSSPPYDFYVDRGEEMLGLIEGLIQAAPPESLFVVESDGRFDFSRLSDPQAWQVRSYPPALVGIYEKRKAEG